MQHPNQTFSAGELYKKVWGKPSYGDVRTVTVHIFNLRKKIEDTPKNLVTSKAVWGKGYVFDPRGE